MIENIAKVALLNTVLAAAGDIETNTSVVPNQIAIKGLQPIPKGGITVTETVAAAEVLAVYSVGRNSAVSSPITVVAEEMYGVRIGPDNKAEGSVKVGNKPFKYTAPAVLAGTAEEDRHNMWASLAWRIRNDQTIGMDAYAMIDATLSGAVAAGTLVTGATSGAKGIILQAGAVENIGVISGMFIDGEGLTNTTTGVATGQTVTTVDEVGTGLYLKDKYGYYRPNSSRGGASYVMPGVNIPESQVKQDTAPVYWVGQGTIMLGFKPIQETSTGNLIAGGTYNYPQNNDPIAGAAYTTFTIRAKVQASQFSGNENLKNDNVLTQILYVKNDATNYAALRTALLALS